MPVRRVIPGHVELKAVLKGDVCIDEVEVEIQNVMKHSWPVQCDERRWSENFNLGYGVFEIYFSVKKENKILKRQHIEVIVGN